MSDLTNTIEANLPDVVNGLERIMIDPTNSLDRHIYIGLHTSIHDFCKKGASDRDDDLLRAEMLYWWLNGFLKRHLQGVLSEMTAQPNDGLVEFYVEQWKRYRTAATYNKHILRWLDRHWIKRLLDEAKHTEGVHDIFSLHLVRWKEDILENGQEGIVHNLRQVIQRAKDGGGVESLEVQDVLESFNAVGIDRNGET